MPAIYWAKKRPQRPLTRAKGGRRDREALFDDVDELLAEESRERVSEARPKAVRAKGNAAQVERIRALIAEGYMVKVGLCGLTVFWFGGRA